MRSENKRNSIIIGALLITIALMTVGYAALATTLTINGTATISATTWDIHFSDASNGSTTGGTAEISLSNTIVSIFLISSVL